MSVNTEDAITFLSTFRPKESIDPQVLDNSCIFVINLSESDLIDANAFIHHICKNIFDKYRDLKQSIDSYDDMSSVESTPEEVFCSAKLDLSQDSDESNDITDPTILVIDGCQGFNFGHFCRNIVSNLRQLKQMTIIEAIDATQLLSAINNDLLLNLSLNSNLKLAVIYANHQNFYLQIVTELYQLLSSLVKTVPIILVVDRITQKQSEIFSKDPNLELLSIRYIDCKQIRIKTKTNDNRIIRDITKPLIEKQD